MPTPVRLIGYVRVSTDEQGSEGHSLAAQREKLSLYCRLHGLHLVDVLEDIGSGGRLDNRPGALAALQALEDGRADGIIVAKLDRLTRSLSDYARLMSEVFSRHQLVSVSEMLDTRTAGGRMVVSIMVTVAQFERERGSERTRDALAHLKSSGQAYGPVPYGYRRVQAGERKDKDGRVRPVYRLEADQTQQAVLSSIETWHHEGVTPYEIARRLNAQNIPTARGGQWLHTSVRSILARPRPSLAA